MSLNREKQPGAPQSEAAPQILEHEYNLTNEFGSFRIRIILESQKPGAEIFNLRSLIIQGDAEPVDVLSITESKPNSVYIQTAGEVRSHSLNGRSVAEPPSTLRGLGILLHEIGHNRQHDSRDQVMREALQNYEQIKARLTIPGFIFDWPNTKKQFMDIAQRSNLFPNQNSPDWSSFQQYIDLADAYYEQFVAIDSEITALRNSVESPEDAVRQKISELQFEQADIDRQYRRYVAGDDGRAARQVSLAPIVYVEEDASARAEEWLTTIHLQSGLHLLDSTMQQVLDHSVKSRMQSIETAFVDWLEMDAGKYQNS